MTVAIRTAKNTLRKQIKTTLKLLTDDEKSKQSNDITRKLLTHEVYSKSERVSVFLSMSDEVRTTGILEDILIHKHCFIPYYEGDVMRMVRLKSLEEYNALPETSWKIKQPLVAGDDALDTGGLDLIIMPGLAFTPRGDRLGRGRGYYDTYLHKCSLKGVKPTTIAIAYTQQIVDQLPTDDRDIPVDYVITAD